MLWLVAGAVETCGYRFAWICIILGSRIRIHIRVKSWILIRICIHVKKKVRMDSGRSQQRRRGSKVKMEPWEVCRPVDSHYSDEKQDPDPDPYQCEADPQHWWQDILNLHPLSQTSEGRSRTDVKSASPTLCIHVGSGTAFSPTYTKPTKLATSIKCSGHFIVFKFVKNGLVFY